MNSSLLIQILMLCPLYNEHGLAGSADSDVSYAIASQGADAMGL